MSNVPERMRLDDDSGPKYHLPLTQQDIPVWTTRLLVASFVLVWLGVHAVAFQSGRSYGRTVLQIALLTGAPEATQLVTYIFAHGNALHLFVNSYVLLSFGKVVHYQIGGTRRYLALFFIGGIVAGIGQVLANILGGVTVPLVGASGGISAVMGYHALRSPTSRIKLFFIKEMSALRGMVYFILISVGAVAIWGLGAGGFAHTAHLAGLFFGLGVAAALHHNVRQFVRFKLANIKSMLRR